MKLFILFAVLAASITGSRCLSQPIGNTLLDGTASLAQFDGLQAEIDFLQSENVVLAAECDRLEMNVDRLLMVIDSRNSQ